MHPELEIVVRDLLARHGSSGRVDLNDIAEVIGTRAVSYEDVEAIIDLLEAAGLRVGEPLDEQDIRVMQHILKMAKQLRDELGRTPTVAEIAVKSRQPSHAVRRALERAGAAARSR